MINVSKNKFFFIVWIYIYIYIYIYKVHNCVEGICFSVAQGKRKKSLFMVTFEKRKKCFTGCDEYFGRKNICMI